MDGASSPARRAGRGANGTFRAAGRRSCSRTLFVAAAPGTGKAAIRPRLIR